MLTEWMHKFHCIEIFVAFVSSFVAFTKSLKSAENWVSTIYGTWKLKVCFLYPTFFMTIRISLRGRVEWKKFNSFEVYGYIPLFFLAPSSCIWKSFWLFFLVKVFLCFGRPKDDFYPKNSTRKKKFQNSSRPLAPKVLLGHLSRVKHNSKIAIEHLGRRDHSRLGWLG